MSRQVRRSREAARESDDGSDDREEEAENFPPEEEVPADPPRDTKEKPPPPPPMSPPTEEAQVEMKLKGTGTAVREAASRIAPVLREPEEEEVEGDPPAEDPIGKMLQDPKNAVAVTRVLPRMRRNPDGSVRRAAVRVEKYPCPITLDEIAEDVFGRFGGRKFKCSIHPNTATGENTILGAFTIENPDTDEPWFEDEEPREQAPPIASDRDPTMMPHPDPMVQAEEAAAKRLNDVLRRKRIKDIEKQIKEADDEPEKAPHHDPKDSAAEARLRAIENERRDEKLERRFEKLEAILSEVAKAKTAPPPAPANNDIIIEMMKSNQAQFGEMMRAITTIQKPAPVVAPSHELSFDKMLDQVVKLKAAFGSDDSRVKRLEETLLESALDRALGGGSGEGPGEDEDTLKFAIKQMTPVLKTYVEKQVEREGQQKGREITADERKRIYADAAAKAAKDLEAEWKAKGYLVLAPAPGQKPPGIPQQKPPGQKPPGLPAPEKKPAAPVEEKVKEEDQMPKIADLPGVGKVEVPAPPGHPAYNPKKALNFVMDSMLSEIRQRLPWDRPNDSYVVGDATECLDDDLLAKFSVIDTGPELEKFLSEHGDPAKVDAIKEAGKDEIVKSWVKRIVITIQDHYKREALKRGK